MLNINKLTHTNDSSRAILELVAAQSIREIALYGQTTHSAYRISRNALYYNGVSENSETFNQWRVTMNISQGGGKVLLCNGTWTHKSAMYSSSVVDEKAYHFESVEDALNTLFEAADETLSATGDHVSVLKYMMTTPESGILSKLESDFKQLGWHIYGDNGDYGDLETDISIAPLEGDPLGVTLNLHATFDWENKKLYFNLGDNHGDGFNDLFQIDVNAYDTRAFSDVIKSFLVRHLIMTNGEQKDYWKQLCSSDELTYALLELAQRADTLQAYLQSTYSEV